MRHADGENGECCTPSHAGRSNIRLQAVPKSEGHHSKRGDIIWLDGGKSWVGTDTPILKVDGEGPRRPVSLKPFGLERLAVTNDRFAQFINATGYTTDSERFGWSFVFHSFLPRPQGLPAPVGATWWRRVEGAYWCAPEGPGSSVANRHDHPVVHISWNDAVAFAAWCGGRLPSEAEWEHAVRAGAQERKFPWGDEEPTDDRFFCNIWQGRFPDLDTGADGYVGTAPVDSFAPNAFGFFNMAGNVWEWCSDPFHVRSLFRDAKVRNRQSFRDRERVMKGGSYLCHVSYCYRYRIAARSGRSPDTSTGNLGFRVAYDV